MIFIGLVFSLLVLYSEGTEEEPMCRNGTKKKYVSWQCNTVGNNRTCYETSFYYDSTNDQCKELDYKGCGGNGNNFPSQEECTDTCKQNMTTIESSYLQRLMASNFTRFNCSTPYQPPVNGSQLRRFYYDSQQKKCKKIIGARGDGYFPTLRYCLFMCNTTIVPERCKRPMKNGTRPEEDWNCNKQSNKLFCSKLIKNAK
uniref:Putative bilaris n=1 Tax=Rhipicephalus pulchellus TaxID=72859 RepID=L7LTP7_RHIPC